MNCSGCFSSTKDDIFFGFLVVSLLVVLEAGDLSEDDDTDEHEDMCLLM